MKTGIHGIAVSGLITQRKCFATDKTTTTNYMLPFKIGDKTFESLVLGTGKFVRINKWKKPF
jgi:hypothetical protein